MENLAKSVTLYMQNAVGLSLVGHVEADWQSSPFLIEKKHLDAKIYCKRQVIDMYLYRCTTWV